MTDHVPALRRTSAPHRHRLHRLSAALTLTLVLASAACSSAAPAQPTAAPPTVAAQPTAAAAAKPTIAAAQPTPASAAPPAATSVPAAAVAKPADASNSLVVAIDSDPQSLDPSTNLAYPVGSEIILNVFDTLVAWKAPTFNQLEGRLAEKWDVSQDGKVYTFTIRQGVKFHDGTPLDAAAVSAAIQRVKADNPFMMAYYGSIDSIVAPDPRTVTITLQQPSTVFLSYLAMPQAAIHSPTNAAKFDKQSIGAQPVGTGPFKFESYTPNTQVTLVANPDYFRGPPTLQRIVFRVIPDQATRRLELEKGTVDVVQQNGNLFSLPVADIQALKENKDVKVLEYDSQILRYIQFNNTDSEIMKDARVRQAIALAIDYDGLVSGVLGDTARRAYAPLPQTSWAALPNAADLAPKRDVARARQLLADAGQANLSLKLPTFTGSSWRDIGTLLQANLKDVGINLEVQQLDFPVLREQITSGKFDLTLGGRQPWYNDPDAHITIDYLSSLGPTALTFRMPRDETLDGLILKAQQDPTQDARKATYQNIQQKLMDYIPGAWLFVPKIIIYTRANIQNLVPNTAPPLTEYFAVSKG